MGNLILNSKCDLCYNVTVYKIDRVRVGCVEPSNISIALGHGINYGNIPGGLEIIHRSSYFTDVEPQEKLRCFVLTGICIPF